MLFLLLDDNDMDLFVSEKLLQSMDSSFVIQTYKEPEKALEYLMSNKVDALFVDNQMPGLSGYDFLLKTIELNIEVPYLAVLTASLGESEKALYSQLEKEVHCFEKPIQASLIKTSFNL